MPFSDYTKLTQQEPATMFFASKSPASGAAGPINAHPMISPMECLLSLQCTVGVQLKHSHSNQSFHHHHMHSNKMRKKSTLQTAGWKQPVCGPWSVDFTTNLMRITNCEYPVAGAEGFATTGTGSPGTTTTTTKRHLSIQPKTDHRSCLYPYSSLLKCTFSFALSRVLVRLEAGNAALWRCGTRSTFMHGQSRGPFASSTGSIFSSSSRPPSHERREVKWSEVKCVKRFHRWCSCVVNRAERKHFSWNRSVPTFPGLVWPTPSASQICISFCPRGAVSVGAWFQYKWGVPRGHFSTPRQAFVWEPLDYCRDGWWMMRIGPAKGFSLPEKYLLRKISPLVV